MKTIMHLLKSGNDFRVKDQYNNEIVYDRGLSAWKTYNSRMNLVIAHTNETKAVAEFLEIHERGLK